MIAGGSFLCYDENIKEEAREKMAFIKYNVNPSGKRRGDCTVRAIAKATEKSWEEIFLGLCLYGFMMFDMPSANNVWGAYLRSRGFRRHLIPDTCPNCYTVRDFCMDHQEGVFILAIGEHVVAVADGDYYDTWDSGDEIPVYYWKKE